MYIVGLGTCNHACDGELPALRQRVREAVGRDVRRVGRFVQLALIGAGQAGRGAPAETAVYLASGRGDMGSMADILQTILAQQRAPRPLAFINTVSNAACFHVAQALGLEAASSFISSQYFALESALQCALVDAATGRIEAALVGVVDALVEPASEHARRLCLPAGVLPAEASNCLQLRAEPGSEALLGTIEELRYFPSGDALQDWLTQCSSDEPVSLGLGPQMRGEAQYWQSRTAFSLWETRATGYLDCTTGLTICDFLSRGSGRMIHLNRDPLGRHAAITVQC